MVSNRSMRQHNGKHRVESTEVDFKKIIIFIQFGCGCFNQFRLNFLLIYFNGKSYSVEVEIPKIWRLSNKLFPHLCNVEQKFEYFIIVHTDVTVANLKTKLVKRHVRVRQKYICRWPCFFLLWNGTSKLFSGVRICYWRYQVDERKSFPF